MRCRGSERGAAARGGEISCRIIESLLHLQSPPGASGRSSRPKHRRRPLHKAGRTKPGNSFERFERFEGFERFEKFERFERFERFEKLKGKEK